MWDDKGSQPSANNEDGFMQARMLVAVIYHSYLTLLWGKEREGKKLAKWASGCSGTAPDITEASTVWVAPCVFIKVPVTSEILLAGAVGHLSLNRGCHSDLVRWEPCNAHLSLSRAKWGHSIPESVTSVTIWGSNWPQVPELEALSCQAPLNLPLSYTVFNVSFCSFPLSFMSSGFPSLLATRCCGPSGPKPLLAHKPPNLAFRQSWQTLPKIWLTAWSTDFLKQ